MPPLRRAPTGSRRGAVLLLSGLLPFAVPIVVPEMAAAQGTALLSRDPYAAPIAEAARRFGIPEAWIRAVMHHESRGHARAISPKGAMGLMQVMPATWAYLRTRHALGRDPYEPRDNILAGTAFLRELHDRYGSVDAMLAAYSAGPGRYEATRTGRPLPAETVAYVAALAPAMNNRTPAGPPQLAAADPLAWTRAPLFTTQPERAPVADPALVGRPSGDARAAVAVRDVSAIAPQSGGLFVMRTGAGDLR